MAQQAEEYPYQMVEETRELARLRSLRLRPYPLRYDHLRGFRIGSKYRARRRIELPDGSRKRIAGYGPTAKTAIRDRDRNVERLMMQNPGAEDITVRQFAAKWLSYKKHSIKSSTLHDYTKTTRLHILPHIGDLALVDVTPMDLQTLQGKVVAVGQKRKRKTRNVNAVDKARKVLKMMYKHALRWQLTDRDPTQAIDPLQKAPPKRGVWENHETEAFLEALRTGHYADPEKENARSRHNAPRQSWYYPLYYTALSTGMRRGELCGLRWSDIRGGFIHVQRTYSQVGSEWRIGPPKTRESRRRLKISASLQEVLDKHRTNLKRHKANTKRHWVENDLVFPSQTGNLLHPPNLRLRLHDYADKAGIPHIRFHDLRKILATNFIRAGGSPKLLQRWLGHATSELAMEIYTDVLEEDMHDAPFDLADLQKRNPSRNPKTEQNQHTDEDWIAEQVDEILASDTLIED